METLREASSAYENGKSLKNILQMCDSVLASEPNLAVAHNLRGMVLEDLKRPEEAMAAYREALRLEPSFSDAQENLSDLENRILGTCKLCGKSIEGKQQVDISINISRDHPAVGFRCNHCGSLFCLNHKRELHFSFWDGYHSSCPNCGETLLKNISFVRQ